MLDLCIIDQLGDLPNFKVISKLYLCVHSSFFVFPSQTNLYVPNLKLHFVEYIRNVKDWCYVKWQFVFHLDNQLLQA